MQLRDYQQKAVDDVRRAYQIGKRAPLLVAPTGSGKCLGPGTPILMFDGQIKPVESVRVGDLLMGPDSAPRIVKTVCSGIDPMYLISPTKGDSFTCNGAHILSLKMTGTGARKSVNISVDEYLTRSKSFKHCAKAWRTGVEFKGHPFEPELPPYILGLWLGDGTSKSATLTSADSEIVDAWIQFAKSMGMECRVESQENNKSSQYHIIVRNGRGTGGIVGGNKMMRALRRLRVLDNKHIPFRYLTGSRRERLELLAGLIDTDGSLNRIGFDYISKIELLARQVAFLARSLGFAAYVKSSKKSCQTGAVGTYFRISISGDLADVPVHIPRKQAASRRQKKSCLVTGFTVSPVGAGRYFGFEIEGPDRLFVLGDFTVTHNTTVFCAIGKSAAAKLKRVTILVHRAELLDQVDEALTKADVAHGLIAATRRGSRAPNVQVASVMTLVRRLDKEPPPDLLIIDEAHHASSASWAKIIQAYPSARILGVTATPVRMGGDGLGNTFDCLIRGPSVAELIERGYLAPPRVFAPPTISTEGMHTLMGDYLKSEVSAAVDKPKVTGDAIEHYQKLTPGLKAAVFCVSLEHAAHIATAARDAGITACQIDGTMDRDVRRGIIRDFRKGLIKWLVSVDLLAEGFDVPDIEVGIFLRPTQSLGLYLQQVGRILRPAPGKTTAFLLDHAGNCQRFGLPQEDREWTLNTDTATRAMKERPISIRVCHKCFSAQKSGKPACAYCGTAFKVEARKVSQEDGELREVTPEELAKRAARREVGMAAAHGDRAKLEEIARIRGYAIGWVQKMLDIRGRKRSVVKS